MPAKLLNKRNSYRVHFCSKTTFFVLRRKIEVLLRSVLWTDFESYDFVQLSEKFLSSSQRWHLYSILCYKENIQDLNKLRMRNHIIKTVLKLFQSFLDLLKYSKYLPVT